ncbi:helix-turn-helix transcriptional regulator [Candidatus Uhrbacteria bacterium]|nr:helix-turn-helix transcriptional regulator [Candidatus Uhrbacteria bacterium]
MPKPKTAQQLERHLKGIANHWRIEILLCIDRNSGITLEHIVDELGANEKTIGEHARRLHRAGLVDKKYKGRSVQHVLSPYGRQCVKFLKTFG